MVSTKVEPTFFHIALVLPATYADDEPQSLHGILPGVPQQDTIEERPSTVAIDGLTTPGRLGTQQHPAVASPATQNPGAAPCTDFFSLLDPHRLVNMIKLLFGGEL